jgi:hypothetical protein
MAITGSCLCGTLKYEIDGPFVMMTNCHCSMCRKHHGAPFATFTATPFDSFHWISGEDAVVFYESSPQGKRGFCPTCGSVAPMVMKEAGLAILPAGNLDSDPGIRPQAHMFVGSKASWYHVTDSLPQHAEYPPEFAGAKPTERPYVAPKPGMTTGSCLCGDVAYEIEGAPIVMYQCHCTRCRKSRGAAHGANLFYRLENFRWTRGESQVVDYKLPEAARFAVAFCRRCGGATPKVARERSAVIVPAAALDTDPGMRPMAHIFVGSKASWFDITDSIPQLAEAPPPPR